MAFILWFKTANKYEGGLGIDTVKHPTRAAAEEATRTSKLGKAYGADSFLVLPFKKMPKSYCEDCDEYRCICKENEKNFIHCD